MIANVHHGAFANIHILVTGGEMINVPVIRKIYDHGRPKRIVNIYGPTECTVFVISHEATTQALCKIPELLAWTPASDLLRKYVSEWSATAIHYSVLINTIFCLFNYYLSHEDAINLQSRRQVE